MSWKSKVLSSWAFISLIFIKCTQLNLYSQCFGLNCLKRFLLKEFSSTVLQARATALHSCVQHLSFVCVVQLPLHSSGVSTDMWSFWNMPMVHMSPRTSKSLNGWQLGAERYLFYLHWITSCGDQDPRLWYLPTMSVLDLNHLRIIMNKMRRCEMIRW